MTDPTTANNQSQVQQTTFNLSFESSGDPALEGRIFSQVHSAGRQLRNISAVIEVLLAAHTAQDPNFAASGDAREAVDTFKQMQLDILRAKAAADPDRLIAQLDALRRVDSAAFSTLRGRLNQWLAEHDVL